VKARIFLLAISLTVLSTTTFSQATTDRTITISFGGDVNGAFPISRTIAKGLDPLGDAANIFRASDISAVNLETAVSKLGTAADKQYTFTADYSLLPALRKSGVTIVNVANNHSFDFGRDAFVDTLKNIHKSGLRHIGGGMNYKNAWSPTIVTAQGIKVAFIGVGKVNGGPESIATYKSAGVTSNWDEKGVLAAIKEAKAITPVVIILVHWGVERTHCARTIEKRSANIWIAAGATAIIGSHPHYQQAIVTKNGSTVAYSLGNLAFYSSQGDSGRTGVLTLAISAKGKVASTTYTPLAINSFTGQPMRVSNVIAKQYRADIDSYALATCVDPTPTPSPSTSTSTSPTITTK
jgi:poly-gamma-glutamate synthesis protein (capsule biosynthesis protein)